MKSILIVFAYFLVLSCGSESEGLLERPTPFEESGGVKTATYQEVISFYEALS